MRWLVLCFRGKSACMYARFARVFFHLFMRAAKARSTGCSSHSNWWFAEQLRVVIALPGILWFNAPRTFIYRRAETAETCCLFNMRAVRARTHDLNRDSLLQHNINRYGRCSHHRSTNKSSSEAKLNWYLINMWMSSQLLSFHTPDAFLFRSRIACEASVICRIAFTFKHSELFFFIRLNRAFTP